MCLSASECVTYVRNSLTQFLELVQPYNLDI